MLEDRFPQGRGEVFQLPAPDFQGKQGKGVGWECHSCTQGPPPLSNLWLGSSSHCHTQVQSLRQGIPEWDSYATACRDCLSLLYLPVLQPGVSRYLGIVYISTARKINLRPGLH